MTLDQWNDLWNSLDAVTLALEQAVMPDDPSRQPLILGDAPRLESVVSRLRRVLVRVVTNQAAPAHYPV